MKPEEFYYPRYYSLQVYLYKLYILIQKKSIKKFKIGGSDKSDDKRFEILFVYETEILSFAKELRKRGRDEEAEKLLKRAERIVPLMEE